MKKYLPLFIIFFLSIIFFKSFIFEGKLPIPSDTIVGLYYPFREIYFKTNPNGLPYKNFLITDPVRQQYLWKNLVISAEKKGSLPLWNPYNFAGTPLLANFQSGAFYPLNALFFILPFNISWSLLIFLQPLLAGIFIYFYLSNLKLKKEASLLGAISFSFSGFFIAWMEWGTILNTALWLPLILLSIDKIIHKSEIFNLKSKLVWALILLFSLVSSFFAGHLQVFTYLFIFAIFYFVVRWCQLGKNSKTLGLFFVINLLFIAVTSVLWYPAIKFIMLSARSLDIVDWRTAGWFIPWQNLVQFLAPDFFGNPTTLNYFGIWNYGEFIGYIGIFPLIMAFFALIFRRDKKTLFFGSAFFLSLIFALPTIFAKFPFELSLPFISTSQPTRLLFITDFALSILTALGFDYFLSALNKKHILYILGAFTIIFGLLWSFALILHGNLIFLQNLAVVKQNLILPTLLFIITAFLICITIFYTKNNKSKIIQFSVYTLIILTIIDLFRFGWKFEPFTNKEYLFPQTPVMAFLKKQDGLFRVMSTDSRILPPNFSIAYNIQTIDGYDPLYLQRYGELMAASKRGKPEINSPFGFNRIITPHEIYSDIINLLGVKYVLSLDKISNIKFRQVFTDGIVSVYENVIFFPRVFFVNTTYSAVSKQDTINSMFYLRKSLSRTAIVEGVQDKNLFKNSWSLGQANITSYEPDKVILKTNNSGEGFLVLTDSFYPTWHAKIDGKETNIYLTDLNFRGIIVPQGKHLIEFYNTLF